MIRTILFPYTFVAPGWAEKLASVWGPVTLLQPSAATMLPETRRLQTAGIVAPVFPTSGTEGLPEALAAFEQWASQHAGSDLGALLEQGRANPFLDNPSQLVAEIRRGIPPVAKPAAESAEALFNACLFLCLAQKFDRQQAELTRDIEALAAREREMMALLNGEAVVSRPLGALGQTGSRDTDAMTALRLKSWARVLKAAGIPEPPGAGPEDAVLFLTDHPEALAQVREAVPGMIPRLRSSVPPGTASPTAGQALPAWLPPALSRLAGNVEPAFGIDLDEAPGLSAAGLVARLARRRSSSTPAPPAEPFPGSSWIGCLTPLPTAAKPRRHTAGNDTTI